MYEQTDGVPIPKVNPRGNVHRKKYPFDELEVGGMFFVPNRSKNNLMSHTSRMGRKLGRKFATRLVYMAPDGKGGWVLADEGEDDAVLGIGVWRTE